MVLRWVVPFLLSPQVVAVIPVIGKSDSMTVEEMVEFKTKIVQEAGNASALEFFQFSGVHRWYSSTSGPVAKYSSDWTSTSYRCR